jgi:hypothetical protein
MPSFPARRSDAIYDEGFMPTPPAGSHPVGTVLTAEELSQLEKLVAQRRYTNLRKRWADQWNTPHDSAKTRQQIEPLRPLEIKKLRIRLAAHKLILSNEGRTPKEVSDFFCQDGLIRPIRPDLKKPLIDSSTVKRTVESWLSSRDSGLSVVKRLRLASIGHVMEPAEPLWPNECFEKVLQQRFADKVSAMNDGSRRFDSPGELADAVVQSPEDDSTTGSPTPPQPLDPRTTDGKEPADVWMTATNAMNWAREQGIKIPLSTMGCHKKDFAWRRGEGRVAYEVEFVSFDRWVRIWWKKRSDKKKTRKA